MGTIVRKHVSVTANAENMFTDWLQLDHGNVASISIAGAAFVGTVTLERRLDGVNARSVQTWTADAEKSYVADEGCEIRLGVRTGAYTSGSVDLRLGIG